MQTPRRKLLQRSNEAASVSAQFPKLLPATEQLTCTDDARSTSKPHTRGPLFPLHFSSRI